MDTEHLKEARMHAGYKYAKDFANKLEIPYNTYSGYERGDREPDNTTLTKLAMECSVTTDFLLGIQDQLITLTSIPVLGIIRAGLPILAEDNYNETITVGQFEHGADYALRVTGDSMIYAGIREGDIVLMQKAEQAMSGQIVAAVVQDMDCMATLKYFVDGKAPVLRAANPKYQDQPITSSHRIIGVFAGLIRTQEPDIHEYQGLIARAEGLDDDWREAMTEFTSLGWGPEEVKSFVNMVRMAKK